MFDWAEYMWLHFGVYSQAIRNSVRYFVTDVEVSPRAGEEIGFESREKYRNLLRSAYGILDHVAKVGDERISMGNSFTSVAPTFRRELECSACHFSGPMDQFKWRMKNKRIHAPCPKCMAREAPMEVRDRPSKSDDGDEPAIKVVHWNPRDILIDHCPVSGRSEFWLKFPSKWKERITEASWESPIFMEDLPREMVAAIVEDKDFKFNRQWFHHSRVSPPSTRQDDMNGWGMPLFMADFEQALLLQTLDRYNEAVIRDYLIPFRVISPPPQAAGGDPMRTSNMGAFMGKVRGMIEEHRMDPATWHTIPFPLQYQALGGEGRQLTTVDLKEQALVELLTSMAIPAEFYQTGLGIQANPIGIRVFERVWAHHVRGLDDWLDWYAGCCHKMLGWERVTASLALTSVHEDDSIVSVKMDLAAANVISMRTALEAANIDYDVERARMRDEEEVRQSEAMRKEREAAMTQDIGQQLQKQPPMTVETARRAGPGPAGRGASDGPAAPGGTPGRGHVLRRGIPGRDDPTGDGTGPTGHDHGDGGPQELPQPDQEGAGG